MDSLHDDGAYGEYLDDLAENEGWSQLAQMEAEMTRTCPRCGARTDGAREGGTEYCTSCGGVIGAASTRVADLAPCPGCGVDCLPPGLALCPACEQDAAEAAHLQAMSERGCEEEGALLPGCDDSELPW